MLVVEPREAGRCVLCVDAVVVERLRRGGMLEEGMLMMGMDTVGRIVC